MDELLNFIGGEQREESKSKSKKKKAKKRSNKAAAEEGDTPATQAASARCGCEGGVRLDCVPDH